MKISNICSQTVLKRGVMITFCSSVKSDEFVDWASFCSCLASLNKSERKQKCIHALK